MRNSGHQTIQFHTALDPDAYAAAAGGTSDSTEIDTRGYSWAVFTIMTGTMASTSTVDAKIQESDTSGSGYADITGAAITQLTEAGTDSDKHVIISINLEKRKRYLILHKTVGTAASDLGAHCVLLGPKVGPVVTTGADEVVTVT